MYPPLGLGILTSVLLLFIFTSIQNTTVQEGSKQVQSSTVFFIIFVVAVVHLWAIVVLIKKSLPRGAQANSGGLTTNRSSTSQSTHFSLVVCVLHMPPSRRWNPLAKPSFFCSNSPLCLDTCSHDFRVSRTCSQVWSLL